MFLVNQEEHPHAVCPGRRRRPRSSASPGGLIPTVSRSAEPCEVQDGAVAEQDVNTVAGLLGNEEQPPETVFFLFNRTVPLGGLFCFFYKS